MYCKILEVQEKFHVVEGLGFSTGFENITERQIELEKELTLLSLKYERLLMALNLEDGETEHIEQEIMTTEEL